VSKRDNPAAAAEFRELVGVDFIQFTHEAPVELLLPSPNLLSRAV